MFGAGTGGLVLQGQRHIGQKSELVLTSFHQKSSRGTCGAAHRGHDDIGIKDNSHLSIISHHLRYQNNGHCLDNDSSLAAGDLRESVVLSCASSCQTATGPLG